MTELWILICMSFVAFNSFLIYRANKITSKLIDNIHNLADLQQAKDRDFHSFIKGIEKDNLKKREEVENIKNNICNEIEGINLQLSRHNRILSKNFTPKGKTKRKKEEKTK